MEDLSVAERRWARTGKKRRYRRKNRYTLMVFRQGRTEKNEA